MPQSATVGTDTGASQDDHLVADDDGSKLIGGAGDDSLVSGEGDDFLNGGSGTDTAVYDWFKDYLILNEEGRWTLNLEHARNNQLILSGSTETDKLQSIEYIEFKNDSAPSDSQGIYGSFVYEVGRNNQVFTGNDFATTTESQPITVDVISNDFDFEGDEFWLSSVSFVDAEAKGSLDIQDGKVVFMPGDQYSELVDGEVAEIAVAYEVTDEFGNVSGGQLTITVEGEGEIVPPPAYVVGWMQAADENYSSSVPTIQLFDSNGDALGEPVLVGNPGAANRYRALDVEVAEDGSIWTLAYTKNAVTLAHYDSFGEQIGGWTELTDTGKVFVRAADIINADESGVTVAVKGAIILQGVDTRNPTLTFDAEGNLIDVDTEYTPQNVLDEALDGNRSPDWDVLSHEDGTYSRLEGKYQGELILHLHDANGDYVSNSVIQQLDTNMLQGVGSLLMSSGNVLHAWTSGVTGVDESGEPATQQMISVQEFTQEGTALGDGPINYLVDGVEEIWEVQLSRMDDGRYTLVTAVIEDTTTWYGDIYQLDFTHDSETGLMAFDGEIHLINDYEYDQYSLDTASFGDSVVMSDPTTQNGTTLNDTFLAKDGIAESFVFESGDNGTDTVLNFNAGEGDVLDLGDLLSADLGSELSLESLLDVSFDGTDTVIDYDQGANGSIDQSVIIENMDLVGGNADPLANLLSTGVIDATV